MLRQRMASVAIASILVARVAAAADFPCDKLPQGPNFAANWVSQIDPSRNELNGISDRRSGGVSLDTNRLSSSGAPTELGIPAARTGSILTPSQNRPFPGTGDTSALPNILRPKKHNSELPILAFPGIGSASPHAPRWKLLLDATEVTPTIGSVSADVPRPKLFLDPRTNLTLGDLGKRDPRLEQQSDPVVATGEVTKRTSLILSPAEKKRLAGSTQCSAAFKSLVTTFASNRTSMGFWAESERTLAEFIPWYYQSSLSKENRDKAAPVVRAQERYQEECLEARIPPELNSSLVQRAVGLLMYGDKVFCTALRTSASEVLTAKHCFQDANSGKPSDDVSAVLNNREQMWFSYEAEPNNRFGVCKASLPKSGARFGPESDHVTLQISPTNLPPSPLKWVTTPIKTGTSLYLRGYFPFTGAAANSVDRMRSTAAGGCFAHSASEQCFFHACQTTPIMSGSPIFVRPEPSVQTDTLLVAGIHIGSALLSDPNGDNGSVCSGIDGTKFPSSNFGYQP